MHRHPQPLSKEAQAEYRAQVREGMFRDAVEACWKQLGVEIFHSYGEHMTDVYAAVLGPTFPIDTDRCEEEAMLAFDSFMRRAFLRRFGFRY